MKFWVMLFSAAVFAGGTCLGVALHPRLAPKPETRSSPEPWGRWHSELSVTRFTSELGLSDDQDVELDRILGETQRDVEAYGRAMRTSHEQSRERVLAILNSDQKARLDGLIEAERNKRGDAELMRSVETYTKILNLTPEQAKLFGAALTESRAKRNELRSKRGDRSTYRDLREAQNARLRGVLDPGQYQRYIDIQSLMER